MGLLHYNAINRMKLVTLPIHRIYLHGEGWSASRQGQQLIQYLIHLPQCLVGGVLISDGTVTWIVDDVRDMTPVGCVRGSLFLPKGYIKANGATVQRADYPRLVHFIESNHLWTDDTTTNAGLFGKGDGSSTFVLPDYREHMMQYTEWNIGMRRGAGLPNITGQIGKIWGGIWTLPTDTDYSGAIRPGELVANQGIPVPNATSGAVATHDNFNASWSNSIYGSSNTVQPPAINVIPILRY